MHVQLIAPKYAYNYKVDMIDILTDVLLFYWIAFDKAYYTFFYRKHVYKKPTFFVAKSLLFSFQ